MKNVKIKIKGKRVVNSPRRTKFIKRVMEEGEENKTDIYQEIYKQKNRQMANIDSWNLMQHPYVQKELKKYKDYIAMYAPPKDVAEKLAKHIKGKNERVSLDAIKEYHKLQDQYPNAGNIKLVQEYRQVITQMEED